ARLCRECKEPVSWGIKRCPYCGEENPTGANPGDVMMLVTGARVLNAIVWLWLWLSDALNPVMAYTNFWSEKAHQLIRLNSHFNSLPRLIGNAIIPAVLWFAIDWAIRRKKRRP